MLREQLAAEGYRVELAADGASIPAHPRYLLSKRRLGYAFCRLDGRAE